MNEIQQRISKIISGLAIYIILSITAAIVTTISVISAGAIALAAIGSGDASVIGALGVVGIINLVAYIGIIYGLFVYYTGLKLFAPSLDTVGENAVKNLSYGALLMMIASLCAATGLFIPFVGSIISLLCSVAAFILNILGYSALQKSETLNELGKSGAKQLYIGFILAIIAVCVGWIPLIGSIAALVLNIMYWVYLFQGWGKIRTSFGN